ncbi:uncharacterized protein IL334_001336 [Kwoniella shivajii]|uniref:Arrestin-like N-terminal domain-containing protein n=1 Tax=Kwoniella shivajii TaxID=564305 RepID=A0ABZ1CRM0_9TREE|nr:hypothetical protein IL334_001336 [Kwoniella shivajii]
MIQLTVGLYQSPVYLCSDNSVDGLVQLSGYVRMRTSQPETVNSLHVILSVSVKTRRSLGRKWTSPMPIASYESVVIERDRRIEAGESSFDFSLQISDQVPPSRDTQFEKITHSLHAIIPNESPSYVRRPLKINWQDRLPLSISVASSTIRKKMSRKRGSQSSHPAILPAKTMNSTDILVCESCFDSEYGLSFPWENHTEIESVGAKVSISCDSSSMLLGSPANIHLHLHELPPSLIVHGWNMSLIQITEAPKSSSEHTSSLSVFKEEFLIGKGGDPCYSRLPERTAAVLGRPETGAYLWKGPKSDAVDDETARGNEAHSSSYDGDLPVRLPSPVIGGTPSYLGRENYSSVEHRLRLTLFFSVFNQPSQRIPSPSRDSLPETTYITNWDFVRPINVLSDSYYVENTPLPSYSRDSKPFFHHEERTKDFDRAKRFDSMLLPRILTIAEFDGRFTRPVAMEPKRLIEAAANHWEETGGLCACFEDHSPESHMDPTAGLVPSLLSGEKNRI